MSYDVDIGDSQFNYTYNLSPMFYYLIPKNENGTGGINLLDGMTGEQAFTVLADALEKAGDEVSDWFEPSTYRMKFDAPNGWGTTVGGLMFMANIMAACARNPRKHVRVS